MFDPKNLDRKVIERGYGAFQMGTIDRSIARFERRKPELPPGFDPDLLSKANNETFFRRADGRECVYFLQVGKTGPIKIGIAKSLRLRVMDLQIANPEQLYVLGLELDAGRKREAELHEKFAMDWIRGEWFDVSTELLAHIAGLATV